MDCSTLNLSDIVRAAFTTVPEEYKQYGRGLNFLQKDITTSEGKRVLIFATDQLLDSINTPSASIAYVDGTFKSASPQFTQIWIIRASVDGLSYPVVYALLENKTEISYTAVLEFLSEKCPMFFPSVLLMDYEGAEYNAVRRVYLPLCSCAGLLFSLYSTDQRPDHQVPWSERRYRPLCPPGLLLRYTVPADPRCRSSVPGAEGSPPAVLPDEPDHGIHGLLREDVAEIQTCHLS